MFSFLKRKITICNGYSHVILVKITDGKESISTQVETGGEVDVSKGKMIGAVGGRKTKKNYKKEEPGFSNIKPGAYMEFEAKQPIGSVTIQGEETWKSYRILSGKNNWIVTKRGDIIPGKGGK